MQEPTFEVTTVTPDMAKAIFAKNETKNRRLRKQHLLRLTKAIQNNEWKVTNQGIALDIDGNLLDGQHRLAAVIKAKKSVRMMVSRNCDPSTFGVIDTGATRSVGDILNLGGCSAKQHYIAAAVKNYIQYLEYPKEPWTSSKRPSSVQVLDWYREKKDTLDLYAKLIGQIHRKFKCFNMSAAIAFCLIADDAGWRTEEIMEYWEALASGANLDPTSPILSFRNQLSNTLFRRRGANVLQQSLNTMIKCWNNWKNEIATKRFSSPPNYPMLPIVERDEIHKSAILEIIKKA